MKNKEIKKYLTKQVWIFPYDHQPIKGYLTKSDINNYKFKLVYFKDYRTQAFYYFNENQIFGIIEKA